MPSQRLLGLSSGLMLARLGHSKGRLIDSDFAWQAGCPSGVGEDKRAGRWARPRAGCARGVLVGFDDAVVSVVRPVEDGIGLEVVWSNHEE